MVYPFTRQLWRAQDKHNRQNWPPTNYVIKKRRVVVKNTVLAATSCSQNEISSFVYYVCFLLNDAKVYVKQYTYNSK